MPQAGFDPLGEKWQLCLNIVVALPPKPPRLDTKSSYKVAKKDIESKKTKTYLQKKEKYKKNWKNSYQNHLH